VIGRLLTVLADLAFGKPDLPEFTAPRTVRTADKSEVAA
jgi:hypothetical protein